MKGFFFRNSIFSLSLRYWAAFFLLFFIFFSPVVEATSPFEKFKNGSDSIHFKVKAIVDPENIKPGVVFTLYVKIELSEGWHIYSLHAKGFEKQSLATQIFFNSDIFVAHGLWKEPNPEIAWDGALGRVVKTHQQMVEFSRRYSAVKLISSGSYKIRGNIILRACNNKVCNLPRKIPYETKINVLSDEN